jgi:hypothetical protein
MSDFDTVLERLLGDAGFKAALARDPAAALRGYDLSDEEREVLRAQYVAGAGGQGPVETRTSKSGLVGLFAPVAGAVGMAAAAGYASGNQSVGSADGVGGGSGGTETLGLAAPMSAGTESIGSADDTGGETVGAPSSSGSFGAGFGAAIGSAPAPSADGAASIGGAPPSGTVYRTVVDVDGDGQWDGYVAAPRAGGGYDVVVDMDRDGRPDFIGHDANADGLIDSADYDTNLDGRVDTRMYDDNGDGWLDRSEEIPGGGQHPNN